MAAPDHAFYFQTFYPFQDEVLSVIDQLGTGLYLTGGTAASRGYLQHRFSDDLDLFANDDDRFVLWAGRVIEALAARAAWRVEVGLREARFARLTVASQGVGLRLELVNDVPSRVGQVQRHPRLGRLDTAENILANKLTALLDRQEPKDLADVWGFCCSLTLALAPAIEGARGKAAGIFAPDLARVLLSASRDDWELVRWISPPDPERYLADLHGLGQGLLLLEDPPR